MKSMHAYPTQLPFQGSSHILPERVHRGPLFYFFLPLFLH